MKSLQKINLILFPYILTCVGVWIFYNQFYWMAFLDLLIAFVAWAICAKDLERMRIMEYLEGTKMDPRDLLASQETIDKIMNYSKNHRTDEA